MMWQFGLKICGFVYESNLKGYFFSTKHSIRRTTTFAYFVFLNMNVHKIYSVESALGENVLLIGQLIQLMSLFH